MRRRSANLSFLEMDGAVPNERPVVVDASSPLLRELIELLLSFPNDEEAVQFWELWEATAEARASGRTSRVRREMILRALDEDPRLRAAYRALTGEDIAALGSAPVET
jgi:hypothetical protein